MLLLHVFVSSLLAVLKWFLNFYTHSMLRCNFTLRRNICIVKVNVDGEQTSCQRTDFKFQRYFLLDAILCIAVFHVYLGLGVDAYCSLEITFNSVRIAILTLLTLTGLSLHTDVNFNCAKDNYNKNRTRRSPSFDTLIIIIHVASDKSAQKYKSRGRMFYVKRLAR